MPKAIEGSGACEREPYWASMIASPSLQTSDPEECTSRDESLELLRVMMRSREFDRRAGVLCRQGRAWFHISSAGHEALAGAVRSLRAEDRIFPHYRDRALLPARGMTLADVTRDLLATFSSHSGGRNMSAPRLVGRRDIHIPFHPELERALLPTVDDVTNAVKSVLPKPGGRP